MTWFAHNIYACHNSKLLKELRKVFQGSTYHVTTLDGYKWWNSRIVHGLPDNGLLVVRPIGDTKEDDGSAEWYKGHLLSWYDIPSPPQEIPLKIPEEIPCSESSSSEFCVPERFLQYLSYLSRHYSVPVGYYHGSMWGGDIEEEYMRVFVDSREYLYSCFDKANKHAQVAVYEDSRSPQIAAGCVLQMALKHFGLNLPTPYFALHTRTFEWAKYKI
jgi:hypothetical protein